MSFDLYTGSRGKLVTGMKQEEDVVSLSTSPRAVSKTLLGPQ